MPLPTASESRVLLRGIRWATYERLLEDRQGRAPRLTFADGELEVMSPSFAHEQFAHRLGRMVEAMTEELGIEIRAGGSTTFRNEEAQIGCEPDRCHWVQNEAAVRGESRSVDVGERPLPDLVIEAEQTRNALDKVGLFGRLGVGEVWRYDGRRLAVHVSDGGTLRPSSTSRCFPWLPLEEFAAWVAAADEQGETTWIMAFRRWVRSRLLPGRS